MGRKSRSLSEMNQLIAQYQAVKESETVLDFCQKAGVSSSCFYRHLMRYRKEQGLNLSTTSSKGKFVELKSAKLGKEHGDSLKYKIQVRILGLKLISMELGHV